MKRKNADTEHKISTYNDVKEYAPHAATKLKENAGLKIIEPPPFISAKT